MLTAQQISDNLNDKITRGELIRSSSSGAKSNDLFDPSKYGLKVSDKAEDHEAGIVGDGRGNTYEIIGHSGKFGQEGLDEFGGDVYSSSLEKDSGIDHSNFNTPSDVAAALKNLDMPEASEPEPEEITTYQPSQQMAEAGAHVDTFQDVYLVGDANPLSGDNGEYARQYKLNLARHLKPVTADGETRSSKLDSHIQQEEDAVAGVSVGDDVRYQEKDFA